MNLPEGYKEWVARVSHVVSHMFPFEWTYADWAFRKWLLDDVNPQFKRGFAVDYQEYMDEATSVWTFIHLQMENYIMGKPINVEDKLYNLHKNEVEHWLAYLQELQDLYPTDIIWIAEPVVIDNTERFQGSIDIVRVNEKTKTVWLYDYKSWWVAKKRWNLSNDAIDKKTWKVKRDLWRFKKVALQLSLYAETYRQKWYEIGGIYVVWLHEQGAFEFSLSSEDFPKQKSNDIRIWTSSELSALLLSYQEAEKIKKLLAIENATIIFNPESIMIFEIRVPTEAYAYINVTIDMYQETKWATIEDKIDDARGAIEYYLKKKKWWK